MELENLFIQHINEAPEREKKIGIMEANIMLLQKSIDDGDKHFKELDKKIISVSEDIVKIKYALFDSGANSVTQNIDLILKEIKEFTSNCVGKSNTREIKESKEKIEEIKIKINKFDDILKGVNGVIWLFKLVGFGGVIIIFGYIFIYAIRLSESIVDLIIH